MGEGLVGEIDVRRLIGLCLPFNWDHYQSVDWFDQEFAEVNFIRKRGPGVLVVMGVQIKGG